MPITALPTVAASLHCVAYSGPITPRDLDEVLTSYAGESGATARRDKLVLFREDVDLSAITSEALENGRGRLRAIVAQTAMPMVTRTALVCLSSSQRSKVEEWFGLVADQQRPVTRKLFTSTRLAAEWIGLTADEIEDVLQCVGDPGAPLASVA